MGMNSLIQPVMIPAADVWVIPKDSAQIFGLRNRVRATNPMTTSATPLFELNAGHGITWTVGRNASLPHLVLRMVNA
jgi:hypothetical protein